MSDNASHLSSGQYDSNIRRTLPYYDEYFEQAASIVRNHFNKPVNWLDVGCGTGRMAETAFETTQVNSFTFSDNSEAMLEIAANRFKSSRTRFIVSDAVSALSKNEYDVVTAIQVFHYLHKEERLKAVKNCYDALVDNGVFISFENYSPNSEAGIKLGLERWKEYQCKCGKSSEQSEEHASRFNTKYYPITAEEHLEVLRKSGFRNAEIIWLSYMQIGVMGIK